MTPDQSSTFEDNGGSSLPMLGGSAESSVGTCRRIHSPVTRRRPLGIVSDVDLLRAGEESDVDEVRAHTVAAQPMAAIANTKPLRRAAALMVERDVSRVIVIESRSGRPIGILSTLDVARALAGFPEQHPIH